MQFASLTGDTAVFYAQSRIIAFKGRVYNACIYTEVMHVNPTPHRVYTSVRIPEAMGVFTHMGLLWHLYKRTHDGVTSTLCVPIYMCENIITNPCNPRFRRAQRWMKAKAAPLVRARRLAVAMVLHRRLGEHSRLAILGEDLVHMCI
jgi:hypothetical protein